MVVTPAASPVYFYFHVFRRDAGVIGVDAGVVPLRGGSSLSRFGSKSSNCNFLLILLHVGEDLRNARGVSREAAVPLLGGSL